MQNRNSKTGIPYGVISAHSIDPEIVQELLYGPQAVHDDEEDYEEAYTEGVLDNVHYATCWLGGALNFFILESPVIHKGFPCSPCIPGACNVDQVGDYEGYGIPVSWYNLEEDA